MAERKSSGFWDMLEPADQPGPGLPWEIHSNPFKGFFKTWKMVTFKPKEAFSLPASPSLLLPILFMFVLSLIPFLITIIEFGDKLNASSTIIALMITIPILCGIVIFGPAISAFWLMLFLYMYGLKPALKPIYRLLCYSTAANVLWIIPYAGVILQIVTSLYIVTMGLSAILKASPGKVFLPLIISVIVPVGVFFCLL